MRNGLLATAARFAHLTSGKPAATAAAAATAAESEPEEEAAAAGGNAEGEEPEEEANSRGKKGKKSKKSESEKDEDDDDEEPEDEEDDDREMKKAEAAGFGHALAIARSRGKRAERARGAAIFGCPAAANNVELAASLAFETNLPREKAAAVLAKSPAAAAPGGRLAARMASTATPRLGASAPEGPKGPQAIAASWDHALADLHPRK